MLVGLCWSMALRLLKTLSHSWSGVFLLFALLTHWLFFYFSALSSHATFQASLETVHECIIAENSCWVILQGLDPLLIAPTQNRRALRIIQPMAGISDSISGPLERIYVFFWALF